MKCPALLLVTALLFAPAARADEIRVVTSGAFSAALQELLPLFERQSGHTVVAAFGGSMGSAPDAIPNRLQRGERFDIVIMAASALDAVIRQGSVVAGSRVDLVRSSIAMAVRAGAAKPDISSVEALTRALLQAKSVAYSSSVSGVYVSTELFQRLGRDRVSANQRAASGRRHRHRRTAAAGGAAGHRVRGRDRLRREEPGGRARVDRVPGVAGSGTRDREERPRAGDGEAGFDRRASSLLPGEQELMAIRPWR